MSAHTLEPWEFVPAKPIRPGTRMPAFIRAPKEGDMPYALEVAGDDYTGYGDDERREADLKRIVACVNACKGINPEAVPALLVALKAMLDLQAARRHPLGQPDEGIATKAVAATAKARAAIAQAETAP